MPVPRLNVVGLDAATFAVIDPLSAAGELPNLTRLLEQGARGVLRSTTHPLTPHAWTTMVTGVNAARHGIWDFAERHGSGYELRLVNGSFRRAPAVWDRLNRLGHRVGLLNVPFTWPPPRVEGFAISGFDAATRDDMTHPPELLGELLRRFGPLALDHKFPLGPGGRLDLDLVRRSAEQKVEMALWLVAEFEPELLFVVFMSADHIHHLAWTEWESAGPASAVADVYRILDEAVGTLLASLPQGGDTLLVSDHGGGSLAGVVNLNAWLAREGFLVYRDGDELTRAFRRLLGLRRKVVPAGARRVIKRAAPDLSARSVQVSATQLLDLTQTRAFAYGTFGNIAVNVRGREAQGIVEPGDEYDRVCDSIAERLLALRGPGDEPVVRAVHRRDDLFEGPHIDRVPDLLVEFTGDAWLGKGNLRRRTPTLWDTVEIEPGSRVSYVGTHRHEGIVVVVGPSAMPGRQIAASIEDIAPTLLYLMGDPVPVDLEGRVLVEALDPSLVERRPPEYVESSELELDQVKGYDAAEAVEVESRLRGLGYLE